jgi:stage II sporulation protein D
VAPPVRPSARVATSTFVLKGAGYGHGRGMSQYGAYGAAKKGLAWPQILSFYYPVTRRVQQAAGAMITVWITADSDHELRVMPAAGLQLSDGQHLYTMPRGAGYTAWRVTRPSTRDVLSYRKPSGAWVRQATPLDTSTWWFSNSARIVRVSVPGSVRELRGTVGLVAGARTVNRLPIDDYVRSVVPSEMPTSWSPAAVRAQAVATRSYAARLKSARRARGGYDVCDNTNCQVYRGYASTVSGRRTVFESSGGNAAVAATSRVILTYRGAIVLGEFGPSNGGSTVGTRLPYQVTKLDPYDGVITSSTWQKTVSAGSIASRWPSVGVVKGLAISGRTAPGRWGGRVKTVKITGSRKTVTVNGSAFQSRLRLRSTLFTVA